jgi:hypothetical protein
MDPLETCYIDIVYEYLNQSSNIIKGFMTLESGIMRMINRRYPLQEAPAPVVAPAPAAPAPVVAPAPAAPAPVVAPAPAAPAPPPLLPLPRLDTTSYRIYSYGMRDTETDNLLTYLNSFLNVTQPEDESSMLSYDAIHRHTRIVPFYYINNPINTTCPITQKHFAINECIMQIKHCQHIFKPNSLYRWFSSHSTCPLCRYNLNTAVEDEVEREVEVEVEVEVEDDID